MTSQNGVTHSGLCLAWACSLATVLTGVIAFLGGCLAGKDYLGGMTTSHARQVPDRTVPSSRRTDPGRGTTYWPVTPTTGVLRSPALGSRLHRQAPAGGPQAYSPGRAFPGQLRRQPHGCAGRPVLRGPQAIRKDRRLPVGQGHPGEKQPGFRYSGFWRSMKTLRGRDDFQQLLEHGRPWWPTWPPEETDG